MLALHGTPVAPLFPMSKSATATALHTSELLLLAFGILLVIGLTGEMSRSEKWKAHVPKFEMMVVLGIGGSCLPTEESLYFLNGYSQFQMPKLQH